MPNKCVPDLCQQSLWFSLSLSLNIYIQLLSQFSGRQSRQKLRASYIQILGYADQYPGGFTNVEGGYVFPCHWLWKWVTYLGQPESPSKYLGTIWENHPWTKCIFPNHTEAGMEPEFPPRFPCSSWCLPLFGGQAVQLCFADLGSEFAYWSPGLISTFIYFQMISKYQAVFQWSVC